MPIVQRPVDEAPVIQKVVGGVAVGISVPRGTDARGREGGETIDDHLAVVGVHGVPDVDDEEVPHGLHFDGRVDGVPIQLH